MKVLWNFLKVLWKIFESFIKVLWKRALCNRGFGQEWLREGEDPFPLRLPTREEGEHDRPPEENWTLQGKSDLVSIFNVNPIWYWWTPHLPGPCQSCLHCGLPGKSERGGDRFLLSDKKVGGEHIWRLLIAVQVLWVCLRGKLPQGNDPGVQEGIWGDRGQVSALERCL